jgi:hypothetical protein
MVDNAVELISKRIRDLQRDKRAIDIAIVELQNVVKALGGSQIVPPKSLDALWGQDTLTPAQAVPGKTADGNAPEVVASPKSGTPVQTGVASLKARLRGNGTK